jgi:hypothetical protein
MSFPQPYPPTPIDFEDWNNVIDALEARFGSSASSFIRDRKRIINSRGNIWEKAAGNIQLAIEDVLLDEGGALWLPKGKITETSGWVVDEEKPVHIFGAGMCWHDLDRGTMIKFSVPNGVHCVDIDAPGTIHFGGLYDMTLYPASGDRDVVHLDSVSDWHMDRIYINQAKRHGLHVESTGDSWNIWVKDSLIENCAQKGIRLEGGAGAGAILKSYFLNNYFYANDVDIELGALDGTTGKVRLCQFHNNQHFNTVGVGLRIYRKVEQILVMGHIFYKTAGNAIDVNDDGPANKCERITIGPFDIDGQSVTPVGLNIQGYTAHVVYGLGQIFGCTTASVQTGPNTSDIVEGTVIKS